VHVYDVRVVGVLRTTSSLPGKPRPLDFAYSETSRWTETYTGVRLEVRTSEFGEPTIEMRMEGKGTIAGTIKYELSGPRVKSCDWRTNRPEPGFLRLAGLPYTSAASDGVMYRLNLLTGRQNSNLRPSKCTYIEANFAKFAGATVGPGGGTAEGYLDVRRIVFQMKLTTPQQAGQLGFPLDRLHAGEAFVLDLKGKTKDHSGLRKSEGSARITFVPRPS
jgi:hypothetical protein